MRILFSLTYYHPYIGGVETLFKRLCEGLVQRGHSVRVITIRVPGTAERETINGVEIERVTMPHRGDRYFFTFFGAYHILRRIHDVDLVHVSGYNSALPGFIAARLARKPVVFTAHEVLGKRWHLVEPSRLLSLAYRSFEALTTLLPYDGFAAVSDATLRDALALGVQNRPGVRRIYNGVDQPPLIPSSDPPALRQRIGAGESDFIYLYFGRPGITKGVDYLLRAAPQIQAQVGNARLVLILPAEPRADYERIARLIDAIKDRASITPLPSIKDRNELFAFIRGADCIVVPSLTEGFGLTTAEACSLGIPVVATRAGSLPEVVSGKYILVEPASETALASGIVRAAKQDFEIAPLKTFQWDTMIQEYQNFYRELVS
jgi:glycosyltransferase involved in cell wall biosynthesis